MRKHRKDDIFQLHDFTDTKQEKYEKMAYASDDFINDGIETPASLYNSSIRHRPKKQRRSPEQLAIDIELKPIIIQKFSAAKYRNTIANKFKKGFEKGLKERLGNGRESAIAYGIKSPTRTGGTTLCNSDSSDFSVDLDAEEQPPALGLAHI